MPNLLNSTTQLLQTITEAANKNGAVAYLHGELALSYSSDRKPANNCLVQVVLSIDDGFSIDQFYQRLTKSIIINKEVANSPEKYHIVSFPYVIEFSLRHNFDPRNNDIATFSSEQNFVNLDTKEEVQSDHLIRCLADEWDISHIVGFAHQVGTWSNRPIDPSQKSRLAKTKLSDLRTPTGWNVSENVVELLTTAYPGDAFNFLVGFEDGNAWLAQRLLDVASEYEISLSEESDLHNLITPKKVELLNIYSEFFRFKHADDPTKRHHAILTYLKLMLDTPSLEVNAPYIDRVSVLTNPATMASVESLPDVQLFNTGACCQSDGSCVETTESFCQVLRGTFFSGDLCADVDCTPDIPGDCQYPPCPECNPEECGSVENGGQPCCCCSSVDVISATQLQCHKQIIISCNRDGTGPGPDDNGIELDFGDCAVCEEVCSMIINSSGPTGCSNPPDPTLPKICCGELPSPWYLEPPTPCECDCARFDADNVCSLHCMSCSGVHAYCRSQVSVGGGDCAYSFDIAPGPECCGAPAGFDVIFAIDNSGSMGTYIAAVKSGIEQFVDLGEARGIVSRLGLIWFNNNLGGASDVYVHGWNADGTLNQKLGQSYLNYANPVLPGPVDYTTNATAFKDALDTPLQGGDEDGFVASAFAFNHGFPGAFGNVLVLVSDEKWPNGSTPYTVTPQQAIAQANSLNYKVFYVGPANGNEQIAIQTGGNFYSLGADWTQIFEDISAAAGIFPSSCACVDFTPLPIIRDVGDPSDPENYFPQCDCPNPYDCLPGTAGELPAECYEFPIAKCVAPDTEDDCEGICEVPFDVNVCGTTITITPTETNLTCCGSLELGCECPSGPDECPEHICCGVQCPWVDICDELAIPFPVPNYPTVESAQADIWNQCSGMATGSCGDDCLEFPTGECDDDGNPILYFVTKAVLDQDVADSYNNCGGTGGACCVGLECTLVNSESECDGIWQGLGSTCTPNPCGSPGSVEFDCATSECDYDDQCIVGSPNLSGENRIQDQCPQINEGCNNVRNPAIALLNNGVGVVAYESMEDNITSIKLQQFHTSVDFKLLANRVFGYGRLQNELRWEQLDNPIGVSVVTIWSYDELPVDIIQGTSDPSDTDSWQDVVIFGSGPLAGGCFPVYATDPTGYDEDKLAWYVKIMIETDADLTSPFLTSDDVYNVRWYIYDYQTALKDAAGNINDDYLNLIGGAGSSGQSYPESDALISDSKQVDNLLIGTQVTHHIYNGERVPVANPSLSSTRNYQNEYENSHYLNMSYQALEDGKWNVYLKQIRASEYSRTKQIDDAISSGDIIPIANDPNDPTPGLGLSDVIYRVVCINDNCTDIGENEFLLQRTVVMEAVLSDGREVINPNMPSDVWGSLCPGVVAERFPKKKVFIRFVQSAVGDRCPDQFQFDDIFQNWASGEDYIVPLSVNSAQQLLLYLTRDGDAGINVGQFDPPIEQGGTLISSSSVGAEWYDSFDSEGNNWSVLSGDAAETLSRFKGFDIGDPILISTDETGHATHPVIQTDYDNHVFIAYEHTDSGTQQIKLVGTKEPFDELPTGVIAPFNPDDSINHFFSKSDFIYSSDITDSSEGTNQLPDMHVDLNNVLHLVWQSNRDRVWEIYYGNSSNNFLAKRITKHDGRSMKPRITSNSAGNLFITWHDNRDGNYEIYMAYHPGVRSIPLYQQDPYLASIRNFHEGWSHTTNVLPLLVENETDGPVCFTRFDVNFYEDRNLERLAFTVSSEKFPFAFSLPGAESDVTIADLSDLDTDWITTSSYDYSVDTIIQENFVATSIEIDTYLDDSSIKNIQLPELNVTGGCSFGSIELRASNIENDPDAVNQWTAEYSLIGKEGALIDLEEIGVTEEIQGRFKQIRLKWSCEVFTETYSVLDGESDADVENNLTWENDRLELRLGLDPAGSPDWGDADLPSAAGGSSFSFGKYRVDLAEASGVLYVVWYYNSLTTGTNLYVGEFNTITGEISNVTTVYTSASSIINGISAEEVDGFISVAYTTTTISAPQTSSAFFAINRGSWENNVILPSVPNTSYGYPVLVSHNNDPGVFVAVTAAGSTSLNYYRSTTYGQSWSTESIATTLDAGAEYSGAIIANTPAVTYKDTSVSYRVYKTRAGGSWGSSVAMTISAVSPNAQKCNLVDNSGDALFFFFGDGGGMSWANYDGSTWTGNQTIDPAALEGFWRVRLINNIPSVAYAVDAGSAVVDLKWAQLDDLGTNSWDIETVETNVESTSFSNDVSIAEWNTDKAAIIPFVDDPILYIEDFDVSGVKRYDSYLRFGNFDIPKDSTIVSSHIDLTSRTANDAASAVIKLLDEYNTRAFEDNTTVTIPIQANSDDAELELPDIWNVGSSSIRFGNSGGTQYNAYLRFPVTIPENSKVIESYITLSPSASDAGSVGAYITLIDGSIGFADTYIYTVSVDSQAGDADYSTSSDRWNNERWDNSGGIIRFGESGNETYESYLRFFIQGIPDYAVISSAKITIEAANTEAAASDMKIKLLDYGDIDTFPNTTVLQFPVDAAADDADLETVTGRWTNDGSGVRFGLDGSDIYDAYLKCNINIDPDLKYIASRLRLTPQADSSGSSSSLIYLLKPNNELWPLADVSEFTTWDAITRLTVDNDDDAHAQLIDSLPKKWVNNTSVMQWGREYASDEVKTWDGYVRFDMSSGFGSIPRYVDVAGEGGSFAPPVINEAIITVRAAADSDSTTTTIHGIDRNVKRGTGTDGFPQYDTIVAEISQEDYDADLVNGTGWSTTRDTVRFGSDGTNTYNAFLRFTLEDKDDSTVVEWSDYISESYLILEAFGDTSSGANSIISRTAGCNPPNFVESTTLIKEVVNAYDDPTYGLSDDGDYDTDTETWNNKRSYVNFGNNYQGFVRIRTSLSNVNIVSATLYMYPQAAQLDASDMIVTLTDDSNEDAYRQSDTKSYHTWDATYPPTLAYSRQVLNTLDPNEDDDEAADQTVVSGAALLGDEDTPTAYILGGPDTPFADGSSTDLREYDPPQSSDIVPYPPAVRRTGDCAWTSDGLWVAWVDNDETPDAPNYKLRVSRYNPDSEEWTTPETLDSEVYGEITMFTINNLACICYLRERSDEEEIYFVRQDGTGTWQTPVEVVGGSSGKTIGSPHCIDSDPDNGIPAIFYVIGDSDDDSSNLIYWVTSSDGGYTWGTPTDVGILGDSTPYSSGEHIEHDCLRASYVNGDLFLAYSRYSLTHSVSMVHGAYKQPAGSWTDMGLIDNGSRQIKVNTGFDLISYHDGQSDKAPVPLFVGRNDNNVGISWMWTDDYGSSWKRRPAIASATWDHDENNISNVRAVAVEEDGQTVVSITWMEDELAAGTTYNVMMGRQFGSLYDDPLAGSWSQLTIASDVGSDIIDTVPVSDIRNRVGCLLLQPKTSPTDAWSSAPVFYWVPRVEYAALIRWYAEEANALNDYVAPFSDAEFVLDSYLAVTATDNDDFDMDVALLDSGYIQPWTTYESGLALPDTLNSAVSYSPVTWSSGLVITPSMGSPGGDMPDLLQEWGDKYGQMTYDWIGLQIKPSTKTDRGVAATNPAGLLTSFTFNPAGVPVGAGGIEGFNYSWTYAARTEDASAPYVFWSIGSAEWQGASAIGVDVTDLVDYFVNDVGSTGYMGFMIYDANSSGGSVKTFYSVENGSDVPYLEVVYSSTPSISYDGSVSWSPEAWSNDDPVFSPDIRSIVQDFVDSCNPSFYDISVAIRHSSGSVLKQFVSFDGVGYGNPAQLVVEYSRFIDVRPFSPDVNVSWTTGAFTNGVEYDTPDVRTIINEWLDNNHYGTSESYFGFRFHTENDELVQVDSKDSGYPMAISIEFSTQRARNKWENDSINWNDSSSWDSTTPVEVESPDLMDLIDVLFSESYTFRYDYDPYNQDASGVGYYIDSDHTATNPAFAGHEIGLVIKDNGSSVLREFESYDSSPSLAAILEIDMTEDGPRNRYLVDSATEHEGVDWTASGWSSGSAVDTSDISDLVVEYLQLPDYDQSGGSYMGIVFENDSTGNPIKEFYSYDSSYGAPQLEINWTTGGALPPAGSNIHWTPVESFTVSVDVNTPSLNTLVEEFLSDAGYSGSGYIGFEISDDNTSSDTREFYSYESGSDPAELVIHYTGPVRSTTGSVLWNASSTPILDSWAIDETVSTPELSTLVQAYIDLNDYIETGGYYIGFVIEDNSSNALKSIYSYETASGTNAAELYVSYRNNFDFTVELNSLATSRLCLGPGESSTGSLDLTPNIRVDSQGQQTVETPLPIEYIPNWTYFTAVEGTTDDGSKVILDQKTSLSCLTCNDTLGDTSWDYQSCSLTVEIPNNDVLPKSVNVAVQIFADKEKNDLSNQLSTFSWGDVGQFTMEDNQPAANFMEDGQFVIAPGEVLKMLAWPPLDPNNGLLCGINYYYTILINDDGGTVPDQVVTSGEWICNCNSGRWADRYEESQQNLQTIQRWRSSGEGLVDTRLTETNSDNFNPTIQIRPDNAGIILYESTRDGNYGIYASAFSYRPSFKMYASAAESIISPFNQVVHRSDIPVSDSDDNQISGLTPEFAFDLYGNIFMTTAMPLISTLVDGDKLGCNEFVPDTMNYIKVRRCGLDDFSFEDVQQDATETICIQEDITREVYTVSDPVFNKLIRLVRVKEDYVKYHVTRTRSPMPVVDQCRIKLEVVGSPESVAVRTRNGTTGGWGNWMPFSPETGSETIEIDHVLDRGSGVKQIQVQVASVAGVVPTATFIVLGDFKPITHSINFYNPVGDCETGTPCPPDDITIEYLGTEDIWKETNKLNMSENIPIASVRHPEVVEDGDDSSLVFRESEYIFVEIEPESGYFDQFTEEELSVLDITPTFDFIHQGGRDDFNLPTVFVQSEGVFRGWITINKEDKGAFRDGLANIVVHFKDDCSDPASVSASAITDKVADFSKDEFNELVPGAPTDSTSTSDPFADDRDQFGQVKSKIAIRPTEDPYFIFGDPNYRLRTNE